MNFRHDMNGYNYGEGSGNGPTTFLPIHVDDTDFLTTNQKEKNTIADKIGEILIRGNLKVNKNKTEQTEIVRRDRCTERWRTVKKRGSFLRDTE